MIKVYQANGSTVTPTADARLYEFLSNRTTGVVLGCEVTSLGGLQLRVASGWIFILGRCVEVQEETISVTPSSYGTKNGRLLLHLDVSAETPGVWETQAQTPLPALTQEDINGSGTIYELPLATYNVNEIQVSDLVSVPQVALAPVAKLYDATFLLTGWTAATGKAQTGGYAWQQTVAVEPLESTAPAVTAASEFVSGVMLEPTGNAETDEALTDGMSCINAGYVFSGAGTLTAWVTDKPDVDVPCRYLIRTEVS